MIIWSDAGLDLRDSLHGPWCDPKLNPQVHFRPVLLQKAISTPVDQSDPIFPELPQPQMIGSNLHQSICMLPKEYGSSLYPRLMAQSPIYAMAELFTFASAAEAQYLDMVRSVLDANTSQKASPGRNERDWRTILVFAYRGLDQHRHQVSATLDFLRHQRRSLDHASPKPHPEIEATLASICLDYEYILDAIDRLKERCDHEVNLIMSGAAVEDALWSRKQSANNFKFTVLATFYVPLSFANSIFGMNFVEPESLRQGFAWWATVTFPVLLISLSFLIWNVRLFEKWRHKLKFRGAKAGVSGRRAAGNGMV